MGGYDSDGNKDPYMIVFVYKTGFKNSVDGKNFKPLRKNSKENHSPAVLCSHASNEAESMCSDSSDDTYRDGMCIVQTGDPPQKAVREALKHFSVSSLPRTFMQRKERFAIFPANGLRR